jgi:hypothetical protein
MGESCRLARHPREEDLSAAGSKRSLLGLGGLGAGEDIQSSQVREAISSIKRVCWVET